MAGKKKSKQDRAKTSTKVSAKDSTKKNNAKSAGTKSAAGKGAATKPVAEERVDEPTAVVAAVDPAPAASVAGGTVAALSAEPARRGPLTEMVPVRFDAQMLADVRARASDDHRSVSSWIRRAVDLELQRGS